MSIRKQIQNILEKQPTITFDGIKKELPNVNKNTLKTYLHQLKRNQSDSNGKKKVVQLYDSITQTNVSA